LVVKVETKNELQTKQKLDMSAYEQTGLKHKAQRNQAFDESAAEISLCVWHCLGGLEVHNFGTAGKGSWRS